jgi:hypothetical protein
MTATQSAPLPSGIVIEIGDGQIQVPEESESESESESDEELELESPSTPPLISQIFDGQIQAPVATPTATPTPTPTPSSTKPYLPPMTTPVTVPSPSAATTTLPSFEGGAGRIGVGITGWIAVAVVMLQLLWFQIEGRMHVVLLSVKMSRFKVSNSFFGAWTLDAQVDFSHIFEGFYRAILNSLGQSILRAVRAPQF